MGSDFFLNVGYLGVHQRTDDGREGDADRRRELSTSNHHLYGTSEKS